MTPDAAQAIESWIFDLDDTLYRVDSGVFDCVRARLADFIARRFALPRDEAEARRKDLAARWGTTLYGLTREWGVDPEEVLAHVEPVDLDGLAPDPALGRALAALPGRRFIHTNAGLRHAGRVLERLGIAGHFEMVFDIAAAGYVPKPYEAPYDRLIARTGIAPARACMIEDRAENLRPAHRRGMTTVWIDPGGAGGAGGPAGAMAGERPGAQPPARGAGPRPFIHHRTGDLLDWLGGLVESRAAG